MKKPDIAEKMHVAFRRDSAKMKAASTPAHRTSSSLVISVRVCDALSLLLTEGRHFMVS